MIFSSPFRTIFRIAIGWSVILASVSAFTQTRTAVTHLDLRTGPWKIVPSMKYDAICLLNVLSADPYYLEYYQADFDHFNPLLTPHEREAFVALKRVIKDEGHGIVSAKLALYLSVSDKPGLAGVLSALEDADGLKAQLEKTDYFDEDGWTNYMKARPFAIRAVKALQRIRFDEYWKSNIRPKIEERIGTVSADVAKVQLVPTVERVLGHPLASTGITVYLLYYSQPHGIRITGTRFLTYYDYPLEIILRNAVHEMFHPPYDLKHDHHLAELLQNLRKDPYLMDKVEHHNPSFGYNSFSGFVEEDCVQALEQQVNQKLGFQRDLREYWKQQDDGMHVLAVALFSLMDREHFLAKGEAFSVFLSRMLADGRLGPGQIKRLNEEFYGAK